MKTKTLNKLTNVAVGTAMIVVWFIGIYYALVYYTS